MLAQENDVDRVLIVRFGRLQAAYHFDAAIQKWLPCGDDLPAEFPESVDAGQPEWQPVWDE